MRAIGIGIFYLACWPGVVARNEWIGRPTPSAARWRRWTFNICSMGCISMWLFLLWVAVMVLPGWLSVALAD